MLFHPLNLELYFCLMTCLVFRALNLALSFFGVSEKEILLEKQDEEKQIKTFAFEFLFNKKEEQKKTIEEELFLL